MKKLDQVYRMRCEVVDNPLDPSFYHVYFDHYLTVLLTSLLENVGKQQVGQQMEQMAMSEIIGIQDKRDHQCCGVSQPSLPSTRLQRCCFRSLLDGNDGC